MKEKIDLLTLVNSALSVVNGRHVVRQFLHENPVSSSIYLIAIGKAAESMAAGAIDALGENKIHQSLIITKYGHSQNLFRKQHNCTYIEAGHPYPDQNSLKAGSALQTFLHTAPSDIQFIFLISGGASSLVEVLPEGIHPEDLVKINRWLLASGLEIDKINAIRKKLSAIKGGRLALLLGTHETTVLLISDVPGDDTSVIGSGLLAVDRDTPTLITQLELPQWIADLMRTAPPFPEPDNKCFQHIRSHILANNHIALKEAAVMGAKLGYEVYLHDQLVGGEARTTGEKLAREVIQGPPGVYLWGGETTVTLPSHPGRGGRNQTVALAAAQIINGYNNIHFLSVGTDGTDGPTEEAGGLVDGSTIRQGQSRGFDVEQSLANADAGSFLTVCGDLIKTGPTGTNVMDIIIGLKI